MLAIASLALILDDHAWEHRVSRQRTCATFESTTTGLPAIGSQSAWPRRDITSCLGDKAGCSSSLRLRDAPLHCLCSLPAMLATVHARHRGLERLTRCRVCVPRRHGVTWAVDIDMYVYIQFLHPSSYSLFQLSKEQLQQTIQHLTSTLPNHTSTHQPQCPTS